MIMSEQELRKALLRLDAADLAGIVDARVQTWAVLERDRLHVRRLTFLTVAVWLLAGALILGGLVSYGFVMPMQALLLQQVEEGKATPAQREQAQRVVLVAFMKGTLLIGFSVAVMAVAALSTVFLIQASRRATLRQVNASLVEISEQLKQLRQALATPPPGAGPTS
jgi:hypothetical protein